MAESNKYRIGQVAKKLNVKVASVIDFLASKGVDGLNPNSAIEQKHYDMLVKQYGVYMDEKKEAENRNIGKKLPNSVVIESQNQSTPKTTDDHQEQVYNIKSNKTSEDANKQDVIRAGGSGLKVLGKIDLPEKKTHDHSSSHKKTHHHHSNHSHHNQEGRNNPTNSNQQQGGNQHGHGNKNFSSDQRNQNQHQNRHHHYSKQQDNNNSANTQNNDSKNFNKPNNNNNDRKQGEHNNNRNFHNNQNRTQHSNSNSQNPNQQQHKPHQNPNAPHHHNRDKQKDFRGKNEQNPQQNREQHYKKEATYKPEKQLTTTVKFESPAEEDLELIHGKAEKLQGLTILGKIDLEDKRKGKKKKKQKPVVSSDDNRGIKRIKDVTLEVATETEEGLLDKKKKRKKKKPKKGIEPATTTIGAEIKAKPDAPSSPAKTTATPANNANANNNKKKKGKKDEPSNKEIEDQIKQTLAKITGNKPNAKKTFRKEKKIAQAKASEEKRLREAEEAQILRVTEFITTSELASLMDVSISEVISKSMSAGTIISINQRLDKDTIEFLASEFDFTVDFASAEEESQLIENEVEDDEKDLRYRAPIVTIMGHVDHGKTTLLDHIRKSNVAAGEAGGITQHIGAYSVKTSSGKMITFLDTPGHEAFTAMRARGAKVTDIVIIVVAADDGVMPQTREAVNHAQIAGVPIVIAINKIDKPSANPDRIKQELAGLGLTVEEWGGRHQSQEISAKKGIAIDELLEKVLIEAEMLDLKANPKRKASGTVIEASLDKGRGYVATLLVQNGTLKVGDVILAGAHYGKVRAMTDHLGNRLKEAGPSTPIQILGIDGAPQAGDKFNAMVNEREAREIAAKRQQILREQSIRATRRLTLNDISRRRAIGNFQELNLIVKGDVDGSVEALSDSLLRLSSEEIGVNIIHKAVGQVSESDVLLASASNAIIIAFQVRPSRNARTLADKEDIEIRNYSIIYQAIDEVKFALEGMLAPEIEESIIGHLEIRDIFKISKVGTIAGCYVTQGHILRSSKVRIIREGIVIHTGDIDSLKRMKDDVAEVRYGFECGLSFKDFNDIKYLDEVEVFEMKEVKRKLK